MKVLVAGGEGQVGSEFETLAVPDGIEIIALGRADLDIADAESIARAFEKHRPGLLINAAAYTAVDKAESEPEAAFKINESAVGLLADACNVVQIPMFHISTDYVFDGEKVEPYVEDDPTNPISTYGRSKEAGERILRARLKKHIILRTSWVFGSKGPNFVKTIVRLACERDRLSVVDDQFGGPTSARSIAKRLIELAVRHKDGESVCWGTHHYSQQPWVSWNQFAQEIISQAFTLNLIERPVSVLPIPSSEFKTKAHRPKNSRLAVAQANQGCYSAKKCDWRPDLKSVLSQWL